MRPRLSDRPVHTARAKKVAPWLAAMRRASSPVSTFATDRRPGSSAKYIGERPQVCWQFTHYYHHPVIQKGAHLRVATGKNNPIAGQHVLAEPTRWSLAALLLLLGLSVLDIIVKSTGGPATPPPPTPPAPSSSKH